MYVHISNISFLAQLWRFVEVSGTETMELENKFLSEMGQKWQFQSYEWFVPHIGSVQAPTDTDQDCKQKTHYYSTLDSQINTTFVCLFEWTPS